MQVIEKFSMYFSSAIEKSVLKILSIFKYYSFFQKTKNTQTPITFFLWYMQKVRGYNRNAYWPVHFTSVISGAKNVYCGIETNPGYMPGCYIQAIGKIYIGDYTQVSANVGIISANHNLTDTRKHILQNVVIGKYCWIGMGAIILPGVILGDFTVVGAGSIVSKSFPDGYCVIAGNPAKQIKLLNKSDCVVFKSEFEYNGYIESQQFEKYRHKYLNI